MSNVYHKDVNNPQFNQSEHDSSAGIIERRQNVNRLPCFVRAHLEPVPLPKPVFKKTSVDPEIPQFKWEDLGNKEKIGRGSFGAVYRTSLGEKELVVKKLFCAGDEDSQKEFLKEAKLVISLKHDNVVQLKAICLQPLCYSVGVRLLRLSVF